MYKVKFNIRNSVMQYEAAKMELRSPPPKLSLTALATEVFVLVALASSLIWLI
jgi:hypothetical protein